MIDTPLHPAVTHKHLPRSTRYLVNASGDEYVVAYCYCGRIMDSWLLMRRS